MDFKAIGDFVCLDKRELELNKKKSYLGKELNSEKWE